MLEVKQGVGRFGWVCAPPENGTPNIEPVPESRNLVLETRIRSREPENRKPKTDLKPEMQEPGHWRHLLRLERRTTELNPQNPKLRTRNPLPENRIANNAGGRVPSSSLAPAVEATNGGGWGRNPKPRTRKLVPELRSLDFAGGRVPASSLAPAVGATDGGTNKTKLETPFPNPGS